MMTMFFLTLRFVRRLALGWLVIALASSGVWAQIGKANAVSGRDYIVAVVDALPITNHDVNVRAALLAQQLRQQKKNIPAQFELLQSSLERLITEKALLQYA